jgi:hypothetical protein
VEASVRVTVAGRKWANTFSVVGHSPGTYFPSSQFKLPVDVGQPAVVVKGLVYTAGEADEVRVSEFPTTERPERAANLSEWSVTPAIPAGPLFKREVAVAFKGNPEYFRGAGRDRLVRAGVLLTVGRQNYKHWISFLAGPADER